MDDDKREAMRQQAFVADLARLSMALRRVDAVARRMAQGKVTSSAVVNLGMLASNLEHGLEAIEADELMLGKDRLPLYGDELLRAAALWMDGGAWTPFKDHYWRSLVGAVPAGSRGLRAAILAHLDGPA